MGPSTTSQSTTTSTILELAAEGATTTSAPDEGSGAPAEEQAADNPVIRGTPAARAPRRSPSNSGPSGPQPTGHIEIPAIGLSHTTYEGVDMATLNHGPGHWPGTALPGHNGNTVFPGHRTTYSRPFWDIDLLRAGDEVIFTTPEGRFVYRVTDTFIVGEYDSWIIDQTANATFTIFGCHPKGSARQRYVAKGELVSTPATTTTTTTRPPPTTTTTTEPRRGLLDIFG